MKTRLKEFAYGISIHLVTLCLINAKKISLSLQNFRRKNLYIFFFVTLVFFELFKNKGIFLYFLKCFLHLNGNISKNVFPKLLKLLKPLAST